MLCDLPFTLDALRSAYADGTDPAAVIDELYARLTAVDDAGIFIHLRERQRVRNEAVALGDFDADKPLWGIPFAVKDNIDVAGIATTAACPAYAYTPDEDAFVVARLRAAGALLIGKTNLDQFATGLVGVRTPYGAPKNAIDASLVPGGSSGGSGVIVGHGIVTFALGTDTAGSGRVPAALNNIVGLKPTLGALSASGVVPACRTLDTVSVFALTVDDAYRVFDVACAYDAGDAYSKAVACKPLIPLPGTLRIGVPNDTSIEFFGDGIQRTAFQRDVARLASLGAAIEPIDFEPLYAIARMLYEGAWVAERYTVIEHLLKDDPDVLYPVTRQIISQAETLSAADTFRGLYRLAELKRVAEPVLASLDMLCVPTIPTFYTVADLEADPVTPNSRLGTYTNFVNLLDMCGIAVPTEARSDGLPGSVTLLARAGDDHRVASVARCLERGSQRCLGATSHRVPEVATIAPEQPERFELAVCGAHMSGLPLNGQLTERGAALVEKAKTAPGYRLFALPGGPPERPGLVRTDDTDESAAIDLEIWSLPKAALGEFVETIPAPLGIGSIELADGRWIQGFLCEARGITDAMDISHLGGWRAYLAQAAS